MPKIDLEKLERHPLSAEYDDIGGIRYNRMVKHIQRHGIVDRKICLHEGKVLDGWQMLRAIKFLNSTGLDIRPEFCELPQTMTAEEYVEIKNDLRRSEDEDVVSKRIKARIDKAKKLFEEGASRREIAAETKVSVAQVERDLQASGAIPKPEPKPKEREPGVEDEEEPEPKVERTKKPPQVVKFSDDPFERIFGPLVRFVDDRGNALGKGGRFKRCHELLDRFLEEYKEWKKET